MKSAMVLAKTFGMDLAEVKSYRYHASRSKDPIYAIGNRYFYVGAIPPADYIPGGWVEYSDQFFAKIEKTIVWVLSV